ncbi:protein SHI RELATED SEQUENCE 1 [Gossypium australe]|uniref:Protein SHI RELATED SEQUENCE 1 n=1 Tax=Gossypium australe TaxID=47621 RepID=A0A5B6USP1_9ROSI|nr:protein SHI RELATED SEQUENCE 1 [Gossypium australe]
MFGCFSLGERGSYNQQHQLEIQPDNWFWYKNEDIFYEGFKLWKQQDLCFSIGGLGVGLNRNSICIFEDPFSSRSGFVVAKRAEDSIAKPLSKVLGFLLPNDQQQQQLQLRKENIKRKLENPTCSSLACTCLTTNTNTEDVDDQYAYQIVVNIKGNVLKGILFYQAPNSGYNMATIVAIGESSSSPTVIANMTTIAANANSNSIMAIASSLTTSVLDPSSLCLTPVNIFMGGTPFFFSKSKILKTHSTIFFFLFV